MGGTPTPKKLSVDSVIIARARPIVAITKIGLRIFGKICLNIMRTFDNPIILDADTYSLFFSTRVEALVLLQTVATQICQLQKLKHKLPFHHALNGI